MDKVRDFSCLVANLIVVYHRNRHEIHAILFAVECRQQKESTARNHEHEGQDKSEIFAQLEVEGIPDSQEEQVFILTS